MRPAREPGPALDPASTHEIKLGGTWKPVDPWLFRSWAGERRVNGTPYTGPVYLLGTDKTAA
jgi:hypothetical protein